MKQRFKNHLEPWACQEKAGEQEDMCLPGIAVDKPKPERPKTI